MQAAAEVSSRPWPAPAPGIAVAVSCTIIAKDEADRIERCIRSVEGLAAEVVVIDSGSADDTVARARALGARVLHNPWVGFGPQKRFAEDQAAHDWILNLDADEWLGEEARAALTRLLSAPVPDAYDGVRLRLVMVYPHQDTPRFWADAHAYVRLYDRRRCRFPTSLVHDAITLPRARRLDLDAPVMHQSLRSLEHLVEKNLSYFRLQAQELRKPRWQLRARLLFEPWAVFLKYYILKRHVTGGRFGLRMAATIAWLRTQRLLILARGQ